MSSKGTLGSFFLVAGAFAGGVLTGLMLAPKSGKDNRKWVADQADEMAHWVDEQSHQAAHQANDRIRHLKDDVEKNFKKNFPDLYEATQDLGLKEEELIGERDD